MVNCSTMIGDLLLRLHVMPFFIGPKLPHTIRGSSLITTMVNKLYLIGGYHGSVKHSPILELYNLTSEWKEVESAIGSFSREYHIGLLADEKEKTFFCG